MLFRYLAIGYKNQSQFEIRRRDYEINENNEIYETFYI